VELKRFDAYVRSLPAGLDSYPQVTQKAHGLRMSTANSGIERRLDLLPPELRAFIAEAPAPGTWVPEVKVHALLLAIGDVCFGNDDSRFESLVYETNRRLLGGPVYSILFKLLGPQRISRGASGRWGQMHRNTALHTIETHDQGCVLVLEGPEHHVSLRLGRLYAVALRVAFELSGARAVTFDAEVLDARNVRFLGRRS
jgi:hypothetical protein